MHAAPKKPVLHLDLFAFATQGKCTAIALRVVMFEVLPKARALFPFQFEPPWC